MSNTDGEDTQRIEKEADDYASSLGNIDGTARYDYIAGATAQLKQLASLREQLAKERELNNKLTTEMEKVTLKQYVFESDPEVQQWLKIVSEDDYDFVSRYWKEMRYDGGTRAKMLLHRALKVYCDEQLKKELNQLKQKEDDNRELVEMGEDLFTRCNNSGYLAPTTYFKYKTLIEKAKNLSA